MQAVASSNLVAPTNTYTRSGFALCPPLCPLFSTMGVGAQFTPGGSDPLRVVLLGAGASADAGIPMALEMLPKIRASLIKDPMWHFVGSAFDAVLGGLRQKQAIGGVPFCDRYLPRIINFPIERTVQLPK
jgi:hypothetical protein